MREMFFFILVLVGVGLIEDVVLIIDGRFFGVIRGVCFGYVLLEAVERGLIAVV